MVNRYKRSEDWDEGTPSEMSKENELPQKSNPEDHGKKELELALVEVGLNPEYWLPKLESKLGITNVKAMSDLKLCINDLLDALLDENVVFSFRNSLEIAAYYKLKNMCSSWTWKLRKVFLDLQNKLNITIGNDELQRVDRTYIERGVQERCDSITKSMETFFSEDKDSKMLIQWKANTENRLRNIKYDLIERTIKMAEEQIRVKSNKSTLGQMNKVYEKQLLEESKKTALGFKGKELGEEELKNIFDSIWQTWLQKVISSIPPAEKPNVKVELQNTLLEQFKSHSDLVNKFEESATWVDLTQEFSKLISATRKYVLWAERLDKSQLNLISQLTESLKQDVSEYIKDKEQKHENYRISYFEEILNIIEEKLKSAFNGSKFRFQADYKVYVSLYLCQFAAKRFVKLSESFQNAHDPKTLFESKKEHFFHAFKLSCEGTIRIVIFVDFVCTILKTAILKVVYNKTAIDIAGEMRSNCPAFNGNRSKLEYHLLLSLAEEENFENYMSYINQPKEAFQRFIKNKVYSYCFVENKNMVNNNLNITLDSFERSVLNIISDVTEKVNGKCSKVSTWSDEFCAHIKGLLIFQRRDLSVFDALEVRDVHFLQEAMTKAFNAIVKDLREGFEKADDFEEFEKKPHEMLFHQLSGCWVKCPLCTAVCTHTLLGHFGDHSVQFHRPGCLTGRNWINTSNFIIHFCASLAASDYEFALKNGRRCPYKRYREAGPEYACWSITPDASSLLYWRWFVSHFRSNLETHFGLKFSGIGEIPSQWQSIQKESVIEELRKQMWM
ncbi:interferon-induced very large GTPase 1-like isoform X2 [Lissotriton helveticus]